jgi:hypothetical protein
MYKFIKNVFIYSLILVLIIYSIGKFDNLYKNTMHEPNVQRIVNIPRYDSLDLLFIGSSYTYSGINPKLFLDNKISIYNLGEPAAGPLFYDLLINDYLTSGIKKKPKYIYILFSPLTCIDNTDDFTNFAIHRYLNSPISNEQIVYDFSFYTIYPSLIINSFKKASSRILSFNRQKKIDSTRGFYNSIDKTNILTEKNEEESYKKINQFVFNDFKFNYLKKVADNLIKNDIKVVFYCLPTNHLSNYLNKSLSTKYNNSKLILLNKYKSIDLSNINLDSTHYRNTDHLNYYGANIISDSIINNYITKYKL